MRSGSSAAGACVKRIMGPGPRCSEFTISRAMAPCTRDSMPTPTRRKTQFFMRMRPDGKRNGRRPLGGRMLPDDGSAQLRTASLPIERNSPRIRIRRPASGLAPETPHRRLARMIRRLFGHEIDVFERYPIGLNRESFARNDDPGPSALRADPLSRFQLQQSRREPAGRWAGEVRERRAGA